MKYVYKNTILNPQNIDMSKLLSLYLCFFVCQIGFGQLLNKPAPKFVLTTQFGNVKKENFNEGKSIILVIADRKSKAEPPLWCERLDKEFSKKLSYLKIAHVGSVPSFMRSTVMYFLKKESELMVDWEGLVCKEYGYKSEHCAIFYINNKGIVKAVTDGFFSESKYNAFVSGIKKDLN